MLPPLPSLALAAFSFQASSDGLAISRVLSLVMARNHCQKRKKRGTAQENGFPHRVVGWHAAKIAETVGSGVERIKDF